MPLLIKPASLPWEDFQRSLEGARADARLRDELAALVPDTTDDVQPP